MREIFFEIRVKCLIEDAYPGPEIYESTVVLKPVGTDLSFPVDALGWASYMKESIGQTISVSLFCESSSMSSTTSRECSFEPLCSGYPDEMDVKRGFCAVGQIIALTEDGWIINSIFPFSAINDTADVFEPSSFGE